MCTVYNCQIIEDLYNQRQKSRQGTCSCTVVHHVKRENKLHE